MVQKKIRENNYDLLRIICTIAVIMLHVSAQYITAITDETVFGVTYTNNMFWTCLYRSFVSFAVPCFMMLSGAFLLSNEQNVQFSVFYKKSFQNIGIPTVIFSFLYTAFEILRKISGGGTQEWYLPIINLLRGEPFYHMWYLYMLIVVYMLVPVLLLVKNHIGDRNFKILSWVFLLVACPSVWLDVSPYVKWDIGYGFCFLGYLMIGYTIREWAEVKKNNIKGTLFILAGLVVLLSITCLRYKQALGGIADDELTYSLYGPYNPLVMVASVLIFIGFSLISIKFNVGNISAKTFYVFLFHAGVLFFVRKIITLLWSNGGDNRIVIPLATIVVFVISYVASVIFNIIYKYMCRKFEK